MAHPTAPIRPEISAGLYAVNIVGIAPFLGMAAGERSASGPLSAEWFGRDAHCLIKRLLGNKRSSSGLVLRYGHGRAGRPPTTFLRARPHVVDGGPSPHRRKNRASGGHWPSLSSRRPRARHQRLAVPTSAEVVDGAASRTSDTRAANLLF